eukprot:TRINITY_DN46364_c0_g1_i1.p1 TRINITY_DN46364_c0_g1~~TRINITY_DN46364_c0_g1_i1.p1  ORF type:complete len:435 (-),score=111.83 TRINITY_DN46364_c0_g1_i1:154-1386(-)
MAELDGADGVSDGKFHGVEISDLKHDLGKSTEGWEQRPDGKWYKRDYYSASKTNTQQIAVTDERDQIIAQLRRELAEKDALINELRITINSKITIITRLEAERAQFLAKISSLEQRITLLTQQQQVVVAAPQPVVDQGNSYYVVRSQHGAELLSRYGKRDIVIDHMRPPLMPPPMGPPLMGPPPLIVGGFQPVQMEQQAIVVQQPAVAVQQVEVKQEPVVAASMTQQEYYRVADEEARRKLDMMDGKLDGKLNGTEIQIRGDAAFGGAAAAGFSGATSTTTIQGGGGAVGMSQQEYYKVADEEARRRLDMMDGKMDGKFNGTDIQIRGDAAFAGAGGAGAAGSAFGAGGIAGAFSQASYTISGSGAAGASSMSTQQEYYKVADEEARRRLDMMDGKMDGKFNGTDIQIKN